jgi:outer membrane protein OmpA-like peptidoglycan-associated protein
LSLTLEYRFMGLFNPVGSYGEVSYKGFNPVGFPVARNFSNDLNHSILLGVRYALWQPPAPPPPPVPNAAPPPPAAPEAARTYLVFFDWDRADLSERARQIIATAASASTHVQTTRIEVNGYTDLSGTAAYNQRLSVRRAQSVEAELVRDGVAASEIGIHGYGESHPLVPTAPGVREPQNRRVEIILH